MAIIAAWPKLNSPTRLRIRGQSQPAQHACGSQSANSANNHESQSHRIHGTGIFTYILVDFCMVHVGINIPVPWDPMGNAAKLGTSWYLNPGPWTKVSWEIWNLSWRRELWECPVVALPEKKQKHRWFFSPKKEIFKQWLPGARQFSHFSSFFHVWYHFLAFFPGLSQVLGFEDATELACDY